MEALTGIIKRYLIGTALFLSRIVAIFHQTPHLHTARFSRVYELSHLLSPTLENVGTSLLLGVSRFNQIACVRPTTTRRELGNVLVCAPPRAGKSLQAIAELLNF